MGDNQSFSLMEATVMTCEKHGVLTKKLLLALLKPFGETDIDSGGFEGITTKDGSDVYDVIARHIGKKLPPKPKLPKNYKDWTEAQDEENEAYHNARYDAYNEALALSSK